MTDSTSELGAALLHRFLDGPEARASIVIDRVVDLAAERLGALDRDRRRRSRHVHPAVIFAAGMAIGIGAVAVVTFRSRLWRRFAQQLREDEAIHAERVASYDDVELAHKVESVVFRDPTQPKGKVSINAERGTVFLRGQVDSPDTIVRIERAAGDVEGVAGVENLLHVPGTPAPHAKGGALLEQNGH
ncbi:MAG: BON domain-containing protein [Actinomycetota bacterium]